MAEHDDLGEMDTQESFAVPSTDRKIITQPYDLSIQTLTEQWKSKILILPDIQREYVWDNGRASRLIESLLLQIPIPVLYFAETEKAQYEIIDGHQRVNSIVRYLDNKFRLTGLWVLKQQEYLNKQYCELPERDQRFLKTRTVRAIIIAYDSSPRMKFETFERLNTGSISLNPQELRNCLFTGSFNKKLRELVKNQTFRNLIGSKTPRRRMVDEELLLRFFALRARYDIYKPPLKTFLNDYMKSVQDSEDDELKELQDIFEMTIAKINSVFGVAAFRLTDRRGRHLERVVNRALFDAHMLTFSWLTEDQLSQYRDKIIAELWETYNKENFIDAIQRATGDRSRTRTRVRETVAALQRAGLRLNIPYDLTN